MPKWIWLMPTFSATTLPGVFVASGVTGDSSFFSARGSNLDATNYDGNGIKLLQDGLPGEPVYGMVVDAGLAPGFVYADGRVPASASFAEVTA